MHADEESDDFVVPSKRVNNAGTPVAEPAEERGSTKGNVTQMASFRTQSRACEGLSGSRTASNAASAADRHTQGKSRMK